jgi:hypothetical protein
MQRRKITLAIAICALFSFVIQGNVTADFICPKFADFKCP